ncbi:hypothetical protein TNCV_3632681 [Trichonephila clavipes]|nr:hypothetical protein TNCV_3632681 [Trichonephila clavipes]
MFVVVVTHSWPAVLVALKTHHTDGLMHVKSVNAPCPVAVEQVHPSIFVFGDDVTATVFVSLRHARAVIRDKIDKGDKWAPEVAEPVSASLHDSPALE